MKVIITAAFLVFACFATPIYAASDLPPGVSTKASLQIGWQKGVGGLFDYPGDVDAYKVNLQKGVNYGAAVQTWCHNKTVSLYDRNFKLIASSTPADPEQEGWVEYLATYTGIYFVQIKEIAKPVGYECSTFDDFTYHVLVDVSCGADAQTKCVLKQGTMPQRAIWAWNDRDWWSMTITKAGIYTIVGYGDRNGNTWYWGGTISLRRADSSVITESNRGDVYECFLGEACLRIPLKPGKYFVAVRMPLLLGVREYQIGVARTVE